MGEGAAGPKSPNWEVKGPGRVPELGPCCRYTSCLCEDWEVVPTEAGRPWAALKLTWVSLLDKVHLLCPLFNHSDSYKYFYDPTYTQRSGDLQEEQAAHELKEEMQLLHVKQKG